MVWAALDNAFDEEVEVSMTGTDVAGYAPPRTVRAGVRFSY
jgi:outer membrane receptor protein involved in Fe transport